MGSQNDLMGKIKNNWQQRSKERTTFRAELRIVPKGLIWTLCALYGVALAIVAYLCVRLPNTIFDPLVTEPLSIRVLGMFGVVTAIAIGGSAFFMLFGYIAADAKRRGMSPVLWVLVSFLVPYLVGAILYFVVRDPLPLACPHCGAEVNAQFNFCPNCKFNLRPTCPECRRAINPGDRFCPHCGFSIAPGAAAPAGAQTA
jgi:RNA polymerase subunit RPABC4/transcription elongation factor Spt4